MKDLLIFMLAITFTTCYGVLLNALLRRMVFTHIFPRLHAKILWLLMTSTFLLALSANLTVH